MTAQEFVNELETWRKELISEVMVHYQREDRERGRLAFSRWKERFEAFLQKHAPAEAKRFERSTTSYAFAIIRGEHPFATFTREYGDACIAFLGDLAESALKGRIPDLAEKPAISQTRLTTSPKVFLCYAREDMKAAAAIFDSLRQAGADVWFDREALLPGEKWRTAIVSAIRNSRFFLALLSNSAVNKKGYVQKEVKQALEVLDEYPDHMIYLIPVRLDDCIVHDDKLRSLQWVDMFPKWEEGLARILKVLDSQ